MEWALAQGVLPLGQAGVLALDAAVASANDLYALVVAALPPGDRRAVDLELQVGRFRLQGRSRSLGPDGLVHFKPGKVFGDYRLALWIEHLAVQAQLESDGTSSPGDSRLFGLADGKVVERRYRAVSDPLQSLEPLLSYYWQGLQEPLMYFSQTSGAFIDHYFNPRTKPEKRDVAKSRVIARKKWHMWDRDNGRFKGEGLRPENVLVFGSPGESLLTPWDAGFGLSDGSAALSPSAAELALEMWTPLVEHESMEAS
jgi:exonuclease V gamma subunit